MRIDLIERLGGYEKAKEEFEAMKQHRELYKGEFDKNDAILLQYRRQHNEYEVGDLIMYGNQLHEIKYIYHPEKARITNGLQGQNIYDFPNGIRHATDAEIAAGRRL